MYYSDYVGVIDVVCVVGLFGFVYLGFVVVGNCLLWCFGD